MFKLPFISTAHAASPVLVTPVGPVNPTTDPVKGVITPLFAEVFNALLWLAGIAAVIYLILAGIRYISSAGNPEKAKAARTSIIQAVIGIIIVVLAFAIINFAISAGFLVASGSTPT